MAGRRRQGADELGAGGGGGAFIAQDTARGVAERIDVEDDGGGVRQDAHVARDLAELEHAVGDGGGAGERIGGGRGEDPGADAHLLERGDEGGVIRDDRADQVVAGVGAAETEGLGRRAGADRAGDGQRAGAVGDEHRGRTRARAIEVEDTGIVLPADGGAGVDERTGLVAGRAVAAEAQFGGGAEGAETVDLGGTFAGGERTEEIRGRALEGHVAGVLLLETVQDGTGLSHAAGDDGVRVADEVEGARRTVALTPEVGIEGQQAVGGITDGGVVGTAAADQVVEAREGRAETVAAIQLEGGVGPQGVQVVEQEDAADGRAVQGVVDEDGTGGVVADVDILLGEAVQRVAADLEAAVVEVDRQAAGIETERAGRGHADGAAVDADAGGERVGVVLQPERRAVDHAGLDDAILGVVVVVDLAGDDDVAAAPEDHGAAGAEMDIAGEGGDAGDRGEARLLDGAAETERAREGVAADGDDGPGAVDRARSTTARADGAAEGQAVDDIRRLHDEGTAAVTGAAGVAHAGDQDRPGTAAELGRGGHDERAGLDEDAARQGVRVVGQHQGAVAGLGEAGGAGEFRRDRRADTGVDVQRGRARAGGRGESQLVRGAAADEIIVARRERDAGEDQAAEGDVAAQRDLGAGTREIGVIIGRERVIGRRAVAGDRGRGTGVEPVRVARGGPDAGAAGSSGRGIGVPEDVRGAGGGRCADGQQRGGHHERRAGEQGTRLRTFH